MPITFHQAGATHDRSGSFDQTCQEDTRVIHRSNPHRPNWSAQPQPRDFVLERFSDASRHRTQLEHLAWRPRNLHLN